MESIQSGWDRNNQHLGPSDALITRPRHTLLETQDHGRGETPPSIDYDVSTALPQFSVEAVSI